MNNKLYQHVTGLLTNDGEAPTVLAVVAVTDPSENYPDKARIIVGSPQKSGHHAGDIAPVRGFSASPAAARQLGFILLQAALDVEMALGRVGQRSLVDSFLTTILNDLRTSEGHNALSALIAEREDLKRQIEEISAIADKLKVGN